MMSVLELQMNLLEHKKRLPAILTFICCYLCSVSAFAKPIGNPRGTPFVWYVDSTQVTIGDGNSWSTAFSDLQDALDSASSGEEIWVAAGTYIPSNLNGSTDFRDASFHLTNGVAMFGGFNGTELFKDDRDPSVNITTLSGDLQQDDNSGGDISDNARHVVTVSTNDPLTLLDGYVIRGGNADGATGGGGIIFVSAINPSINNCTCVENVSTTSGGALLLQVSTGVTVTDSLVQSNISEHTGGAIAISENSTISINKCKFRENQSNTGGSILNAGNLTISNSLLTANYATDKGGAISSLDTATLLRIVNCTITQNVSTHTGGGIVIGSGLLEIANSIIWGNVHLSGDDAFAQILAINSPSPILITHSCVQNLEDGLIGTSNINANPRFYDQLGPDGERASGDEDFSLLATSPCIDAGVNADAIGLQDVVGNARYIDDPYTDDSNGSGTPPIVDMGAYEYNPTGLADVGGIVIWNTQSGSFSDAANWFPQRVPTQSDIALFNLDSEIEVTVATNITVSAVVVTQGEIDLDIPNIDFTVEASTSPVRILAFGDDSKLTVKGVNGRFIIPNAYIQIGGDDDDDDFDDFFEVEDYAELIVGLLRILDGGTFHGGVGDAVITAEVRNTGGAVDPSGLEPGLLVINGDYSAIPQDETDPESKGMLLITFDDTSSSGHTFDTLTVNGTANIGGVLGMQFKNDYPAVQGDIFNIITSSTLTGTFDTVWSTGLPSNLYCEWLTTLGVRGTGGGGIGSGNPITFDAPMSTSISNDPTGIVVADFDSINGIDVGVVIPNSDPLLPGSVSILLNNGSSGGIWQGFTPAPSIAVGVIPRDIAISDLDGDGDVDIVVANFDDNTISTLFNDGSASFTTSTYATADGPATIAIANYFEDGLFLNDIAVGCKLSGTPSISVMHNQSTAGIRGSSFTWINSINIPLPSDILPGDVTTDKDFDYVVLGEADESVTVYSGNGNGGIFFASTLVTGLPSGSGAISAEFSDLNNDGLDDLVTVNNSGGSISLLRNEGTSFGMPSTVTIGTSPEASIVNDLDNDGDDDLIVSVIGATSLQRELMIIRNDTSDPATITLTDIGTPQASGFVPTHVSTGDFNSDGYEDIVSITEVVPLTGHAAPAVTVMLNTTVTSCAADFDGEGNVAVADLLQLIAAWGASGGAEDLDGNGIVNVADILILIAAWGPC